MRSLCRNRISLLYCVLLAQVMLLSHFLFSGTSTHSGSGNAFVSFVDNDEYAKGAVALAQSLINVRSKYPLVVLVTSNVSPQTREQLSGLGCTIIQTEGVTLPKEITATLKAARWGPAFSKLVAWNLTQYNKLVWVDSDMLFAENADQLFDLHIIDKAETHTEGAPLWSAIEYPGAGCDEALDPNRMTLNSGVMVFRPSSADFAGLMDTLTLVGPKLIAEQGSTNDQDIIIHYFTRPSSHTTPSTTSTILSSRIPLWKPLSYTRYGAQIFECECESNREHWVDDQAIILHYTAGLKTLPKPWKVDMDELNVTGCMRDLFLLWHQVYHQAISKV